MKSITGVSKEKLLDDIAKELTGLAFEELKRRDPDDAETVEKEAKNKTAEWERILYFA